jgi:hypothetical protein
MPFAIGDAETIASTLSVIATSSNTNLVPNANLALGGSGASRTVQVTPIAGRRGAAVIKLRVTDSLGAFAQREFIFSVFDAATTNNSFKQPRGIYVLDSAAGTTIRGVPMHDGNIRSKPFVDGYVLRTEWATLEPTNGVFDFTIITNIFAKLPANQKLSLLLASGVLPTWLNTLPGVATWTAGTPSVTAPVPWNATVQERYRLLLVALGDLLVDGVPLRNHPRLAAFDPWIPGLKSGIRDPDQTRIHDIPTYTRSNMQTCVLTHLANATDNFPNVPVMIGFWAYTDSTASPPAWEVLRQLVLTQQDGIARPRVGFWMENLAANRLAANTDPWVGVPNTTYTAPLYNSQSNTFVGYQVLGSWSKPFNSAHVDNLLNGTPEDGMDYGFNDFQCRYYEHYQADIDFANYTNEFQRWHDFIAALPAPPTNTPPTISSIANQTNRVNTIIGPLAFTVTDAESSASNLVVTAMSSNATLLPTNNITIGGNGTIRSITITPASNHTGTAEITLSVSDGSRSVSTAFTVTVFPIPSLGPLTLPGANQAQVQWLSQAGVRYQVCFSPDLLQWIDVGTPVTATNGLDIWMDDGTLTGSPPGAAPRRFYRVKVVH